MGMTLYSSTTLGHEGKQSFQKSQTHHMTKKDFDETRTKLNSVRAGSALVSMIEHHVLYYKSQFSMVLKHGVTYITIC